MTKSRSFSIFLLKPKFDASNSLKEEHKLKEPEGSVANLPDGAKLFIGDKPFTEPWWKDYWGIEQSLLQTMKGAVLFLPVNARWFALTFGYSHHNLKETCYEYDFGLRTTLNALDPHKIKSSDSLTPESAKRERKQMPIASELTLFDINSDENIIKKLTGCVKKEYENLFKNITGSSSLKITSKIHAKNITTLCDKVLEIYLKEDFKITFPDIQNIVPIKDPAIISTLNSHLLNYLSTNKTELTLTTPTIIDYDYSHIFLYCTDHSYSETFDDIYISDYLKHLNDNEIIISSIEQLKSHKLIIQDENGNKRSSHSIFKCLLFDCEYKKSHYHLCEGEWYKINKNYINKLEHALSKIFIVDTVFSECNSQNEGDFNLHIAKINTGYVCLDKKNIAPKGQTQIEPCDLLTFKDNNIQLIHVKFGTHSSTLSHLFNQGLNSAEILRENEIAKDNLKNLVDTKFHNTIDAGNYSVLFGIITSKNPSNGSRNLPIFSRISLMRTKNALKRMNINASVVFIKEISNKK